MQPCPTQLSLAPKPLPPQSRGDSPSVLPACGIWLLHAVAAWSSSAQAGHRTALCSPQRRREGPVPPRGCPAVSCWMRQPLQEKFPKSQATSGHQLCWRTFCICLCRRPPVHAGRIHACAQWHVPPVKGGDRGHSSTNLAHREPAKGATAGGGWRVASVAASQRGGPGSSLSEARFE